MRESQRYPHLGRWLALFVLLTTLAAASISSRAEAPTSVQGPDSAPSSEPSTDAPTTVVTADPSTTPTADDTPAETEVPTVDSVVPPDALRGISMTDVPDDVLVPTNEGSLDAVSNPINGRRGSPDRVADDVDCLTAATEICLISTLDLLGFDVTSGSADDRERSIERAIAVVQLDAGLPMTGVPDDALLDYLGIVPDTAPDDQADEVRRVGTSARGRPITATRYGDGPRTVLVVGQTHGDEEAGLRVLLRARAQSLPEEITLWVIPTMNPDGLVFDTRYLSNGDDPNRLAPSQIEQQAVYEFTLDIRPILSVWYHQNYGWVGGSGASMEPAKLYQELTGLGTLKRSGDCVVRGFMWCPIDDALGSSSILVELPDVVTPAEVRTHAVALLAVAAGHP